MSKVTNRPKLSATTQLNWLLDVIVFLAAVPAMFSGIFFSSCPHQATGEAVIR